MKKTIFRSLLFAILLVIGYYAVQVLWGYYLTLRYMPDIGNSSFAIAYESHHVELGIKASPLSVISEIMIIMAIGVVIYISGSYVTKKRTTP